MIDQRRKHIKFLDEMDILTIEGKKRVIGKIEDIFTIIKSRKVRKPGRGRDSISTLT